MECPKFDWGGGIQFTNGDVGDHRISLNGTTNLLNNGSGNGTVYLSDPNNSRELTYSGYTHSSPSSWGTLSNNGYFQLNGRIGGLTNISYTIDGTLKLQYGYVESGKPTYYEAIIDNSHSSFNFPEDNGYPDTFKVINESGSDVNIADMTFFYTCSQEDEHAHVHKIIRDTSDGVKYYDSCDICDGRFGEVDFSAYSIKIGTSSGDKVEYTPYNLDTYAGSGCAGTLEFDYQNLLNSGTKRFVLTLNGDNSGKTLYIDSNVENSGNAQIIIKSENNAKIGGIEFKGGYGVLVFMGETLTFPEATLDSEARYTTVKSPLVFSGPNNRSKDGIYVNNGTLVLESDVTISQCNHGIQFKQKATGGDLEQNGGTLSISNCNWGISGVDASYYPTVNIKSNVKISGCRRGTQRCNIEVGDAEHAGKLMIDISKDGSSGGDPSVGIYLDSNNTLNFVNGAAAIYSSNTATDWTDCAWSETVSGGSYCSGIKFVLADANDVSKYSWAETFKFGFGNLARGFDNTGGANVTSFFGEPKGAGNGSTGIRSCDLHTYHLVDSAWALSSKPTSKSKVTAHGNLDDFLAAFN